MENMTRKVERMARKNAKRRLWYRIVAIPAAIVVFVTTYALILPAIAMEGETYCGFEEHTHTEECYTLVPACGFEDGATVESTTTVRALACTESAHQHTEECYNDDGELVCAYADFLVHEHTSDCYSNGELVCSLPEIKAHTHDETCYSTEPVLICGQTEGEGHIHSDACYTPVLHTELICTVPESEGHTHTESCFATVENTYLACGLEESAGHVHGEGCYTTYTAEDGTEVTELTCTVPESEGHTHTEACYITETSTNLVCGQEESAGHVHSESCYNTYETMELTCGQAETAPHVHTDACYSTELHLACNKPEIVLHTHTEECLNEDGYLICGMTEVREHQHTDACFTTYEQTIQIAHTHTDLCYLMELTCTKPEHTHIQSCYKAPEAEATAEPEIVEEPAGEIEPETAEVPEAEATAEPEIIEEPAEETEPETAEVPETEAVEEPAEEAETEAAEPVLVCEKAEHTHDETCFDENGELICELEEHIHDESCFAPAGAETETTEEPETEAAEEDEMVQICEAEEHIHTSECIGDNGQYICGKVEHTHNEYCRAQVQCNMEEHTHDESCYDENGGLICEKPEHIHNAECCGLMIIEEEEAPIYNQPELVCGKVEHIHTNECMTSDLTYICGMDEHVHSAECYATPMKVEDGIVKSYNDGKVSVIAVYGSEANIPEEAVLNVYRLTAENPRYEARMAEAKALLNSGTQEVVDIELYNIGFYVNGVEVEPTAPVSVTFRFLDAARFNLNDNVSVVHFGESGTEVLEAESDQMVNAATFETGSFSDFALRRAGEVNNGDSVQDTAQNSASETQSEPAASEPEITEAQPQSEPVADEGQTPEISTMSNGADMPIITPAPGGFHFNADNGIATIATNSQDLADFLTDVEIVDSQNETVGSNGELVIGESYTMKFTFKEGDEWQFSDGELTLNVKDLFKGGTVEVTDIEERTGYITVDNGVKEEQFPYTYWVKDGVLHVKLPDEVDSFQNVSFVQGLQFEVQKGNTEDKLVVDIPGDQDLTFDVEAGLPEAEKTAGEYNAAKQTVDYTVELTAAGGKIDNYTFTDTLDDGPLTYGDPLTVTLTVYDTEENGGRELGTKEVTVHPKKNDDGSESFEIDPNDLPELTYGQRMVATYQAKLRDDVAGDDGLFEGSSTVNNTVNLHKDGDDGFDLKKEAQVKVESQAVDKHGGSLEGDYLYWHVDIGNGSGPLGEVTVKDTLTGEHSFAAENSPSDKHAKHHNEGMVLRVYDPKTGEVAYTLVIPWDGGSGAASVHGEDGKEMSFTVPDLTKGLPAGWKAYDADGKETTQFTAPTNYYLEAQYYTKYTAPTGVGVYKNDVDVNINGKNYKDDGTAQVIGPGVGIDKNITSSDDQISENGMIHYRTTVNGIIPTEEWEGKWYAPFRVQDRLTLVGPGGEKLYVENYPLNLQLFLTIAPSAEVTLGENTTGTRYGDSNALHLTSGEGRKYYVGYDNYWRLRTPQNSPFKFKSDGTDSGTEVGRFYIVFNSDDADTSNWDTPCMRTGLCLPENSVADFRMEYDLSLSARVFDAEKLTADQYKDHEMGTLKEYLDKGWTLVNTVDEDYYLKGGKDEERYRNPEYAQPVQKSGVLGSVTEDGVEKYYIDYTIKVRDESDDGKGSWFSRQDLIAETEDHKNAVDHGAGITVTDHITRPDLVDYIEYFWAEAWNGDESVANGRYENKDLNLQYDADGNFSVTFDFGNTQQWSRIQGDVNDERWTTKEGDGVAPGTHPWYGDWTYSTGQNKYFLSGVAHHSTGYGRYNSDASRWYGTKSEHGEYHSGEPMVLVFRYRVWLDMDKVMSMPGSMVSLLNDAGVASGDKSNSDKCTVEVKNGGMDKTVAQASEGSELFNFEIKINKNRQNLVPENYDASKGLKMTDVMSENLELQETSLEAFIIGEDGTETPFLLEYDWDSTTHTLTMRNIPNGEYVVIKYQARSNTQGTGVQIKNDAHLLVEGDYNSGVDKVLDITQSSGEGSARSEAFVLHKRDAADENKYSEMVGAEFLLYIIDDTQTGDPRGENNKYGKPMGYGDNYKEQMEFGDKTGYFIKEFTIGPTGDVTVMDGIITSGKHFALVEVKAPEGYMLPSWPNNVTEFYMDKLPEGVTDVPVIMNKSGYTINNTNYNYELPETGGEGTMLFTLGGIAALSLAGAIFCGQQRRRARGRR